MFISAVMLFLRLFGGGCTNHVLISHCELTDWLNDTQHGRSVFGFIQRLHGWGLGVKRWDEVVFLKVGS